MADNPKRAGFRWIGNIQSPTAIEPPIEIHPIADDYGTALYIGDVVKIVSTGYLEAASAGDSAYGIFAGMDQIYDSSLGAVKKSATYTASTSYDTNFSRQSLARVIPVRGQKFVALCDDKTTATTEAGYLAFRQENVEWVAGTATGDYSGTLLDISGHNTTNTLSVRIRNLHNKNLVDFSGLYVPLEVEFNLIQSVASGSTTGT